MILRELTILDADFLFDFESKNFKDGWTLDMIKSAFNTGRFFGYGYFNDNQLVAFITFSFSLDTADLESIVTHTDYRKTGLGSSLIEKFIKTAKGNNITKLFLEVRESNINAINLYNKFGFSEISKRKNYYSDGETALVLVKELS